MVTPEHIEFLEKTPPDTPLEVLQSADWQDTLSSKQAYVEGFWMKFRLNNQSTATTFALGHSGEFPVYTESRAFIAYSNGTSQSNQWQFGDPLAR